MHIFVRFAAKTNRLPNKFMTKAYDDRLFFVLEGKGKLVFENGEWPIAKNTLCYYPAGTAYWPVSSAEDPLEFITVNFDFGRDHEDHTATMPPVRVSEFREEEVLYRDDRIREGLFRRNFVLFDGSAYRNRMNEFLRFYNADNDYGRQTAEAILQTVCCELLYKENQSHNELYLRIKDYLDGNYRNIRVNKDCSEALRYHDYYLNKVFKRNSGTSIHQYIMDLRLQEAAYLAEITEMPVYEIALTVGFTNAAHFSTAFKARYAVSPSEYRKTRIHKISDLI